MLAYDSSDTAQCPASQFQVLRDFESFVERFSRLVELAEDQIDLTDL